MSLFFFFSRRCLTKMVREGISKSYSVCSECPQFFYGACSGHFTFHKGSRYYICLKDGCLDPETTTVVNNSLRSLNLRHKFCGGTKVANHRHIAKEVIRLAYLTGMSGFPLTPTITLMPARTIAAKTCKLIIRKLNVKEWCGGGHWDS